MFLSDDEDNNIMIMIAIRLTMMIMIAGKDGAGVMIVSQTSEWSSVLSELTTKIINDYNNSIMMIMPTMMIMIMMIMISGKDGAGVMTVSESSACSSMSSRATNKAQYSVSKKWRWTGYPARMLDRIPDIRT